MQRRFSHTVPGVVSVIAIIYAALLIGMPAQAAPGKAAACGAAASQLDVNGDGFDDAVVGNPYATVNGKKEAGSITVLFGDSDCRIGEGKRVILNQGSFPGSNVEAGDHFGWSVSIGNLNGTGAADILVGSPGEDWKGHVDAGIAHVISFNPDGTADAVVVDQSLLTGAVEAGDQFGSSTAVIGMAGDFTAGAIGAPGEDSGTRKDVGEVDSVLYLFGDLYGGDKLREGMSTVPGHRRPVTDSARRCCSPTCTHRRRKTPLVSRARSSSELPERRSTGTPTPAPSSTSTPTTIRSPTRRTCRSTPRTPPASREWPRPATSSATAWPRTGSASPRRPLIMWPSAHPVRTSARPSTPVR